MKKLLVFIFIFTPLLAISQTQEEQRMSLMKDFLHDIFHKSITKDNIYELSEKYIYFQSITDTSIHYEQRVAGVGYVCDYFKKTYKDTFDEKKIKIVPYTDLKDIKVVKFHPNIQKYIYGVLLNKEVIMYINFEKDKIASIFPFKETEDSYAFLLGF